MKINANNYNKESLFCVGVYKQGSRVKFTLFRPSLYFDQDFKLCVPDSDEERSKTRFLLQDIQRQTFHFIHIDLILELFLTI